ncbi:hypothetical protein F4827_005084 [Paraburkholderia bannensis]|uniref:Uncharacterized protein n=1 Tax=Paraburkholderia bannensis TaxID=765414 RepID=A0A7W9U1E9_9BURK|nr:MULTISPECIES: hypothetical protein [Paraburkholderia]MBB6105218.1 hypothetical protein [Paraburkholderia bannensis]
MNAGKSNAGVQYTFNANVATFSFSASQPLIALYSPNAYVAILRCVSSNGSWTVQIWSNVAAAVTVYIFDQALAAVPSGAGFGMQVFNANGELVADARQRLARVLDTQSGNIMGAGPGWGQWNQVDSRSASWTYPGASKVGVAALGTAFVFSPTGGGINSSGWYNIGGFQTSGATVNFLYQYYQVGSTFHPGNNTCFGSQYDWRFMAIDLSNI